MGVAMERSVIVSGSTAVVSIIVFFFVLRHIFSTEVFDIVGIERKTNICLEKKQRKFWDGEEYTFSSPANINVRVNIGSLEETGGTEFHGKCEEVIVFNIKRKLELHYILDFLPSPSYLSNFKLRHKTTYRCIYSFKIKSA